jgi:hypothetical protein|nr:MAG TPA: hypothetical protein [Bacteriophage sp.]
MTKLFNETIGDILEKDMKGDMATAHVWTSSEYGAKPLSDMVQNMLVKLYNDGYKGKPEIQYSSTFDTCKGFVIFSAFIIVYRI